MLVKKVNSAWKPSERPDLEVGDVAEMTNPKQLILNGDAVGIGEHGEELTAYELYGVIIDRELDEFREYQKMKRQKKLQKKLKKEQVELKQQVQATQEDEKESVKLQKPVDATMAWKDLIKVGSDLGVYKVGMNKSKLITAINNE